MHNELLIRVSWALLALVHLPPALVLIRPQLVQTLYNLSPVDDSGILIVHRGALFTAIVALSLYALFQPDARQTAAIVVMCSVVGFLFVYARAGLPSGPLRTIAIADLIALAPLFAVTFSAFSPPLRP